MDTANAMQILTVTVPLPDRALCGNGTGRANGFLRARLVKEQREAALRCAEVTAPVVFAAQDNRLPYFPTGRVRVDVLVLRDPLWAARRLDDDNLIRGLKATLDGLADAGIVANDRQFTMGAIAWETADPYRGAVVLTLSAVAAPGGGEGA